MADQKQGGQKANDDQASTDEPTVKRGHNEGRKLDGGDDQGDGHRPRHNDDKGEGRGVAGGGKNQNRPQK